MPKNADICVSILKSAQMSFVIHFPSSLLERVDTNFNVYAKLEGT